MTIALEDPGSSEGVKVETTIYSSSGHYCGNFLLLRERALRLNALVGICHEFGIDPLEQPDVVRTQRELVLHYDSIMDLMPEAFDEVNSSEDCRWMRIY